MNDITIFNHLGNDIRVMTDKQGEPLFVLKDICDALDLKNISDVASRLDEDGVGTTEVIDNLGRTQKTNVVTEAGLYEVIFMSRKPEAKAFKRWVTREVHPPQFASTDTRTKGYAFSEYPFYSASQPVWTPGLQKGVGETPTPLTRQFPLQ